jgi:hypothetical protein
MTFPVQSVEKASLVSVIAMLLQFNPKELQDALQATKSPVYSALPVKEVKRDKSHSKVVSNRSHAAGATSSMALLASAAAPRSRQLTPEEADFQEKLNKISGDILSMSMSYDDL